MSAVSVAGTTGAATRAAAERNPATADPATTSAMGARRRGDEPAGGSGGAVLDEAEAVFWWVAVGVVMAGSWGVWSGRVGGAPTLLGSAVARPGRLTGIGLTREVPRYRSDGRGEPGAAQAGWGMPDLATGDGHERHDERGNDRLDDAYRGPAHARLSADALSLTWPARTPATRWAGSRLLVRMNRGRNAYVAQERLAPPDSRLTRAARDAAMAVLPSTLLNHSHRTYVFARALGELEQLDVDAELLFAAAMLHDAGLAQASGCEDFTLTSARMARVVSERVGLSTAATATLQTAITMHHSPRVTVAAGPVAYLLAAGAGVDVVGLRCWDLPQSTLLDAVDAHPRDGFKEYFTQAWAHEAARVPQGRARAAAQVRRVQGRHRAGALRRVSS